MNSCFKRFTFLLALALIIALLIPAVGLADAGSFSGDTDFGGDFGSDWDSDWGSDSGWDSGSDWGDGYSSSGSFFGFGGSLTPLIVVAVIVILLLKKKKPSASVVPGAVETSGASLLPLETLKAGDPGFSAAAMQEKIANLYVRMQNCWTAKAFEPMRPYFTDSLFAQFERQLEGLKSAGRTNYVDRISVLGVEIRGCLQNEQYESLVARVRTRIVDYTLNDATGDLVSGDRNRERFMVYEWTMIRNRGVKTQTDQGTQTFHCPSCGAPMNLNQSAQCAYCGSVVTNSEFDWVVSAIKGISQRTGN